MISGDLRWLQPFIDVDRIGRLVVRPGRMVGALDLAPDLRIDGRERRVARGLQLDAGDHQAIGVRDGLRIDIGAAHHADLIDAAAQRIAARRIERGGDARSSPAHPGSSTSGSRRHHDIGAAWQRPARERLVGLAAHHHRLAPGDVAEVPHLGLEPPRQFAALPDHAVLGDGDDQDDARPLRSTQQRDCAVPLTPPPRL